MDWEGRRKSDNVEDQRGTEFSGSSGGGGTMLNLLPAAVKLLGFKGTVITTWTAATPLPDDDLLLMTE
ncbi:MAG: neutral zinc metallopeptidase [Candidatus Electrothrix sp. YB6]